MEYKLRKYQQEASDAAIQFFMDKKVRANGILVLPTGAGKSLVIADIAHRLHGNTIVLQPSKEILEQNYAKLCSYGVMDCAIFSASLNKKEIARITFATIGSVANRMEDFKQFHNVIIDECHLVSADGGRYVKFIKDSNRKVLGLTATPYRLCSIGIPTGDHDLWGNEIFDNGCILKFITRTNPRVFSKVLYYCQILNLLKEGYLAKLRYFDMTPAGFGSGLKRNSTGMNFDDESVEQNLNSYNIYSLLIQMVRRLLKTKDGKPRRGILVFTKNIKQAEMLSNAIPNCAYVTGETPKKEREQILHAFKKGRIKVVANVGVLTTGFDYPQLDTVVLARPTMSLAMYYQMVGRVIRPYEGKDGWVIDLCGTFQRFGRVENLWLTADQPGLWVIKGYVDGRWKQLTNVAF